MNKIEIWLLAFALAMDCFAVSMVSGIVTKKIVRCPMLTMALLFGVFQGGMTFIGWWGTSLFSHYIESIDHWIAFCLLIYLGGRMIYENFRKEEEKSFNPLKLYSMLTLSIATSIDALAVGISMACLNIQNPNNMIYPVVVIALVSFVLSLVGLGTGLYLGKKIQIPVESIGGGILIIIGIKILVEHLS